MQVGLLQDRTQDLYAYFSHLRSLNINTSFGKSLAVILTMRLLRQEFFQLTLRNRLLLQLYSFTYVSRTNQCVGRELSGMLF